MSTFQLHRALGLELEVRFLIGSNKKNSKHQPSMTGVLLLKVMKCVEESAKWTRAQYEETFGSKTRH